MQSQSPNRTQYEQHLDEVIAAYLLASEAGVAPDQREWLARYPDLARDLEKFFTNQDGVERVAGELRQAVHADHANEAEQHARQKSTADATHLAGGTVLGDFRVVREIGRGGMGIVYEAEQVSLGRRVALKVLPYMGIMDPRRLQRFRHEAQAAAQLHHTNIVPVFFVGGERGVHYYAMQFIDGRNLAEVIRELQYAESEQQAGNGGVTSPTESLPADGQLSPKAPLNRRASSSTAPAAQANTLVSKSGSTTQRAQQERFRTAAQLGVQAAEALDYAHQQGILHRDVKPANLMLDATGHLWVTDFGLARMQADSGMTMTGDLLGTLRYMSPEQALAKRIVVDHRTDIYSLGATLYELLTLQPALQGDDRQELLRQIAFEDPKPLRRLNRAIPAELETIVLKAMAKNPAERYGTAQDLADDLRRYLDHRPIFAKPPTLIDRTRKWARRNKPLMVSLGISAVLLLVGLIVGVVGYGLAQRQLAKDQTDLAAEKEQARQETATELYHALLRQSSALRLAREPGYRKEVWKNLHRAISLETPEKSLDDIRDEVLACLNDPIGLEPVESPALPLATTPVVSKEMRDLVPAGHLGAVTEDGSLLAVAGRGVENAADVPSAPRVRIYDATGKELASDSPPVGNILSLTFSSDGSRLVGGGPAGLVIWDAPALTRQAVITGTAHSSVAIHPGGHIVAALSHAIELWALNSNRRISWYPRPDGTARIAFSANGEMLVALSADNRPLMGWFVSGTAEQRHLLGHRGGVPGIAFSPDSTVLASVGKDRLVRLWDVQTGGLLKTLEGHLDPVQSLAFSPNGSWLVTGGEFGELRLWDARTRMQVAPVEKVLDGKMIWQLRFDRSGRLLVASGGGGVTAWAVRSARGRPSLETILQLPDIGSTDLTVHPAGTHLVMKRTGSSSILHYDLANALGPSVVHPFAGSLGGTTIFHPNGKQLVYADGKSSVILDWDNGPVPGQTPRALAPWVRLFVLSADGRWGNGAWEPSYSNAGKMSSGGGNYDLAANRQILPMPSDAYIHWCVAISPDGTRLGHGLADGQVVIWNLEQIRARLAEFGIDIPSTAVKPESIPAVALPSDVEFERMVELNRSRQDQIQAACRRLYLVERELAVKRDPRKASLRNALAWTLVMEDKPEFQNPAKAVEHGRQAVELEPTEGMYWNTLGAAEYRAGHWQQAISTLEKSMELRGGGDGYDWYFLAMAHWRLGKVSEALAFYKKAASTVDQPSEELGRLQKEAAELLGISGPMPASAPAQPDSG